MGSIVDDVVSVGTFGLIDTDFAGEEAQKASRRASGASVAAQERALDYLQEREALPQAYREAGLQGLGGEFGLTLDQEGNVISDGSTISERALTSNPCMLNLMVNNCKVFRAWLNYPLTLGI